MNENESASYTLSAKFLKGSKVLEVTVTRKGSADSRYLSGVPYQWKFMENTVWNDGNLCQEWRDQQITYVCYVQAPTCPAESSGLLQLRLKTEEPQNTTFVYLGPKKTLRYWVQQRNGITFLCMQSESGTIDATGLYLRYGNSEMRFPPPYEQIGPTPCKCRIKNNDISLEADSPESLCVKIIRSQR